MSAEPQAVILGSMRGNRHLDASRSTPFSLETLETGETVLDWALHALACVGVSHITYVGGYQIQKVIERYPNLIYRYHAAWQDEGELSALLASRLRPEGDCFVFRSDTVVLPEALSQLAEATGDVVLGGCATSQDRNPLCVIRIRTACLLRAFAIAEQLTQADRHAGIDQWIRALSAESVQISRVDLSGLAAPISDQLALARTVFGSKARTLERIQPLVKRAVILDQVRFSIGDWTHDPERILQAVTSVFGNRQVVVRSSAHAEDGLEQSLAGRFCSVLDVPGQDGAQLREAINRVMGSYASDGRTMHVGDEVFVQPQISDLAASGVLLTRDPETGAPYDVLNLDCRTGRSDAVTSGSQATLETIYVSRWATLARLPQEVKTCITVARELEQLTHLGALDIELGIDRIKQAYVFQVRPIPSRLRTFELADEDLREELEHLREFLAGHMRPHPHLHGRTTLFSTMSDWNPAEMIGTTPRPLALSLYQRLIGDEAWAKARARIGYRDVAPEPLIISLGGRPYVDVRASLNSFLPDGLEPEIGERWVDHGLDLLRRNPQLHDKVEFDVALTCATCDVDGDRARLSASGLGREEVDQFEQRLVGLTDRIIRQVVCPIDDQLASLDRLQPRQQRTLANTASDPAHQARQLRYLLEDCERFGLVPFSILARYAFIAMSLLRSLRSVGIFTAEEYDALLRSIPTVATELSSDLARHAAGELTTDAFLARYGHLRPSSYDITSPHYAAAPELYLASGVHGAARASAESDRRAAAALFEEHAGAIDARLRQAGFSARTDDLRDFVLRSIPAREMAKFTFMKTVNALLEGTARLGEQFGCDREALSFLPIERMVRWAVESPTGATRTQLRREVEFAKKRWNLTCALRLPHLVKTQDDVEAFQLEEWTPNFVSSQRVVAAPIVLDGRMPQGTLDGRIVLIRAADPGFDWIFGHAIAGLVTQYGGVASHMAIRAAEFGLPAAIGCGELIFERLRAANLIELDGVNRNIRVVG